MTTVKKKRKKKKSKTRETGERLLRTRISSCIKQISIFLWSVQFTTTDPTTGK